jgi:nitroreductase
MSREVLLQILDFARWAPSGDNTQPWRFEIVADDRVAIHGYDTRKDVLYDFDGHASQMAHGALLETLTLAATRFGLEADWQIRADRSDSAPIYDVTLLPSTTAENPLVASIQSRSVQRRKMQTTPLTAAQKDALIAAVGNDYSLQFLESFSERFATALLLWKNAYLRLTCPEAYPVHRDIIEWNARYSIDRIPDQAVGTDPLTTRLMQWAMQSWERVDFLNRYLGGTILPRVELDFIPAINCATHVLLRPRRRQTNLADHVDAGRALQRLWLTVTHFGLHLQPEMTPVIFRWYVQAARPVSRKPEINAGALALAKQFEHLVSAQPGDGFAFFCRVGQSPPPAARSLRKAVRDLMSA